MGDISSAIEYGLKAAKAESENGLAYTTLGNSYLKQGDYEEARAHFIEGQSMLS
jgi:Flp pilus assembly protein TadD